MSQMAMMLLVVGIFGAAALGFVKRCELFGICEDEPLPPMAPPVEPLPEEEEEDGEEPLPPLPDVNNVYINNPTQYVPVPYPVGHPLYRRPPPVIIKPPRCSSTIRRHGRTYTITNRSRLPDVMIMIFPPPYIKEGQCVYALVPESTPKPVPKPPTPLPHQQKSKDCCTCKTTGRDYEVKCSNNGGKTWSTNPRYRYDLTKSLSECAKGCRYLPPNPWPSPVPGHGGGGWDNDDCDGIFCKRYPSRCPKCRATSMGAPGTPGSTAAYGSVVTNRMSFL